MAYRNGTYVAFHANGTVVPGQSDFTYYRLLQSWDANKAHDFSMVNSHDKSSAVRDSSSKETLKRSLRERLSNSKNMLLIVGETTKLDADWIPFEISEAVDRYKIPIIAAYTMCERGIIYPQHLQNHWPHSLHARIVSGAAKVIHIPFKQLPIMAAIGQFSPQFLPSSGLTAYNEQAYRAWNLL